MRLFTVTKEDPGVVSLLRFEQPLSITTVVGSDRPRTFLGIRLGLWAILAGMITGFSIIERARYH
jgi:hypothetical protein